MTHTPAITLTPRPTAVAGIFEVPSRTYPGEVYTTDIRDAARPACNCPAGQHDFETCKHVKTCWHVRACLTVQAAQARSRALVVRSQGLAALLEAVGLPAPTRPA